MRTKVEKEGDVFVVYLQGRLSYEIIDPLNEQLLNSFTRAKVLFNFKDLDFVGSSGITSFMEAMRLLQEQNSNRLKFCNVSSEFQRFINVSPASGIEVYDSETNAKAAFRDNTLGTHLKADHQILDGE